MNAKKIINIIMIVFGIIMLFMGLLFGGIFGVTGGLMGGAGDKNNEEWEAFQDDAIETEGEIIDVDNGTVIEYYCEEDDRYYKVTLSVTSSLYPVGKQVSVYYNEDNPRECMVPEIMDSTYGILSTTFSGIGIVLGILFGGIGLVLLIAGIIMGKKNTGRMNA